MKHRLWSAVIAGNCIMRQMIQFSILFLQSESLHSSNPRYFRQDKLVCIPSAASSPQRCSHTRILALSMQRADLN